MREVIQALQSLQELDQEIFRLQRELQRLPEERAQRRSQIDATIARAEASKGRLREVKARIKEIEDVTTQSRQRMRKVEHEASSSRSDVALLAAYHHQIKTLRKEIGEAEDEGVALVEQAEAIEAEAKRIQGEVAAAEQVFAQLAANVDREMGEAARALERLQSERRKRMSGQIPAESLTLYERLLQARDGLALAELDGRICQACFMEVPPNLSVRVTRGVQLAQCPSCDRILFPRLR